MARRKSTKKTVQTRRVSDTSKLSPVMQLGVVVVIVGAMLLLMYAGKLLR